MDPARPGHGLRRDSRPAFRGGAGRELLAGDRAPSSSCPSSPACPARRPRRSGGSWPGAACSRPTAWRNAGRARPPVAAGPLDEVFGIDRSEAGEAVTGPVVFHGKVPGRLRGLEIEAGVPEPGLRLTGAEAWGSGPGGTPVASVHRHGKGRAIYLNLDVSRYSGLRGGGAVSPELITGRPAGGHRVPAR